MSSHKQSSKNKINSVLQYWVAFSFSFAAGTAYADELDTLQFNTSVSRAYDDNLFRVKNNQTSDQITTYTAGVKLDKTYSLQRIIADISYVDYKYQNSSFLDFDAINYDAKWLWSLTPALTGTLSTSKNKTLNGFSDFRLLTQNIRTTDVNQFRTEYSPYKVWSLIAGVTESDVQNSQTFNAIAQYKATALDYGAKYNFASGSNLTFLAHNRDGKFDRPLNQNALFDNGFTENEFEVDFILKPTGKSNLTSKIGHLSREYDNFTVRNYDVWIGYVRYDLLLTGKIKASIDLTRSASPFETEYSTYSLIDSATLGLNYLFSEKISISLTGRLAERDFKKRVLATAPSRSDEEKSISASISWRPIKNLGLTLSSIRSSRDASSFYNNFDYEDLTTSVMLDLKI
ncbi:XrtB/PEP-CTERM-associated polysaccharide biosynthesis outer membrane protein EpsL [Methylophilus sp. 3sh_L]|uniref:XrtB/PEP-CTERM-associated polysaccharide biosynthesis outer membrane protein EpsL n=1 Tax=Methylophilus sp. 3sh_L TaxID=3377114 RepID=UPI00398F0A3D